MNINEILNYNYIFPLFTFVSVIFTTRLLYIKIITLNKTFLESENINMELLSNIENFKSLNNNILEEDYNSITKELSKEEIEKIELSEDHKNEIIKTKLELVKEISDYETSIKHLDNYKINMNLDKNILENSKKILEYISLQTIDKKNDKTFFKFVDNALIKNDLHSVQNFVFKTHMGLKNKNLKSMDDISDLLHEKDVDLFLSIVDSISNAI